MHHSFIPIFLGGVNHGSGNKPPWSLPAKAKYGKFDTERAKKYHGLEKIEPPDFFPPVTLLVGLPRFSHLSCVPLVILFIAHD